MTPKARQAEIFESEILPLLDTGYRVAILCTGGSDRAVRAVEDAAITTTRRPSCRAGWGITFLRMVLASCAVNWRPAWEEPLPDLADLDLELLTDLLGELPVPVRAAVALHLAGDFAPEVVAEILMVTRDEVAGLGQLAWQMVGHRIGRTLKPAARFSFRPKVPLTQ